MPRTGRPRRIHGTWGAYVGGSSRPRVGELIRLTFRDGGWDYFAIRSVVDGKPGCWRVHTEWRKARKRCANRLPAAAS